jgi:superfamily I DNA and/or RNA helicase
LFVVSPHHKQINRIKAELEKRGLKDPFFVETVEKMQGQETNVGIVSYGLSDPEQAASEAEFIYSLNRLNVAITRAQSKMIVFIPKPLFYPLIEVMENEELNEGISYMLNLKKFMEENGECKKFNFDKDGEVTVSVFRYNKKS